MKQNNKELKDRIYSGTRITPEEALTLFSWDIIELGRLGDLRRKMIFPHEQVGFIIDRIINYSNICEAGCAFCAYHAKANRVPAYELSNEEIIDKVKELKAMGGSQVMLQGGLHPTYRLEKYLEMIRITRETFPECLIHAFSPSELFHIAKKEGMNLIKLIGILKNAGLDSVPGASDILVDRVRKRVSPKKITTSEWCTVMDALHHHNMMSSATMTYGMGETYEERIEHLRVIREVQERTGIIRAFIPWSFSPASTQMSDIIPATGIDYLKMVAIGRIFLDNVVYIQAGWLTEGMKLAQVALAFGANDMGGVLMEEVVVKSTGIETRTNMDEMIAVIRNAGKKPVQRDSVYRVIREW
ncbi:MAG: CofH family radical SAM protein [Desulfatiglans sp.]|mgnify:CR=1 FL=1|jgi:cyclic dehypoxanthinyl futalosine synthase|nr:CofH family radical SAM protein [Desulfatiglans sp.]